MRSSRINVVLVIHLIILIETGIVYADPLFILSENINTSSGPKSICTGYFDNDEYLDLAVGCYQLSNQHSRLIVYLNDGSGSFIEHGNFSTSEEPVYLVSGDLDGDSFIDIAMACHNANLVCIYYNDGSGNFSNSDTLNISTSGPAALELFKFDDNSFLDIAVANRDQDSVTVFLGDSASTFASSLQFAAGNNPHSVNAADFDNNGCDDLAVANWDDSTVSVYINTCLSAFEDTISYATGDFSKTVYTSELNGDEWIDLITVNQGIASNSVSILINNGDSTFLNTFEYAVGASPYHTCSADFDKDIYSSNDIAVVHNDTNTISVLLNNGDGSFGDTLNFIVGDSPNTIVCGDFDNDSDIDLAVTNGLSDNVSILLGEPALTILSTTPIQNALNVPVDTDITVTFDTEMDESTINGNTLIVHSCFTGLIDGTLSYDPLGQEITFEPDRTLLPGEIISVTISDDIESSDGIPLSSGFTWEFTAEVSDESPGEFALDTLYYTEGVGYFHYINAADYNSDGFIDLVAIGDTWQGTFYTFLNNGDGTFGLGAVDSTVGSGSQRSYSGDFDNDSDVDIAFSNLGSHTVTIHLNNGDGSFTFDQSYIVGSTPHGIVGSDFDQDGDLDLAVALYRHTEDPETDSVVIMINDGAASYTRDSVYAVGSDANGINAGDFDNDGDTDLAVTNLFSEDLIVLFNNGESVFGDQISFANGRSTDVEVRDFNNDSCIDLIATVQGTELDPDSLLKTYSGDCTTFQHDSTYLLPGRPGYITSGDLDGDGSLDIVYVLYLSGNIGVSLNDSNGIFPNIGIYATDILAHELCVADFDLDGDLDIATVGEGISILENKLTCYQYVPGDANMPAGQWPPLVIGADVTYLVNYFRTISAPCVFCNPECDPECLYAPADVNGDCMVIGSDVTYLVNYFRGLNELSWCPCFPPCDLPLDAPVGWPGCEE